MQQDRDKDKEWELQGEENVEGQTLLLCTIM